MPSLLIRDLDDALHARLKARAVAHRRSLAVEARETLRNALAGDDAKPAAENLVVIATRLFGPEHGIELDLPPRSQDIERPTVDFIRSELDP